MSKNVSIKHDELVAMLILEELYEQCFYKSERPDLHNKVESIGIEVTRAYDKDYEKDNGELRQSNINDVTDKYAFLYDNSIREITDRIVERLVDKMQKLTNYKRYPHEYLYMRTSLRIEDYSIKTLFREFDSLKDRTIVKCRQTKSICKPYEIIMIECTDAILIWKWDDNSIVIKTDVLGGYEAAHYDLCKTAQDLIDREINGEIDAAGDHTLRKNIGW